MASRRTSGRPGLEADASLAGEILRLFPHGILLLDRIGAVVTAISAARGLLGGEAGGDLRGRTCCELLGCGRAGPLAESCLTQLALERAGRLPEMRLDLPSGSGALWVSAARLGDQARVVLEVRPGDPRDRRRRTEPQWTGPPALRIVTLGRTRVESREGPIGGAWLEQRPGQVLRLLVCERRRVVPAEAIATAIWPDAGPRAVKSLRQAVHELRDRLEPGRSARMPSSFVILDQGGYALDPRRVRIDADDFERHVEAGLRAFSARDSSTAAKELRRGLDLYEGDLFAEDPYAEWAAAERDRLRELAARALRILGELALRQGSPGVAALHLSRLADIEPYDLPVHRRLMEALLRDGRRSEAHRRYTALRSRMLRDFGEDLDFDVSELARPETVQLRLV